MTVRLFGLFAVASSTVAVGVFAGCGDDDNTPNPRDAAADQASDTGAGDSGGDASTDAGVDAAAVARGKYLVDHVSGCGDCHTPRLGTGAPDMSKYLSGVECFVDVNGPDAAGGCLATKNLTNDATGLKNLTDAQIKALFTNGTTPDGGHLSSVMPYWVFASYTSEDADAVVAYLRTVPAVVHDIPPDDPIFVNPPAVPPIDPASIPAADGGASAANGRYLASVSCIDCHTPELPPGSIRPIDMTKPFSGGHKFQVGPFTITSKNITSDATGLAGWTPQMVVRALKEGRDDKDAGLCPPMPSGPFGPFGGLTDQDALDLANYVVGLPPIANAVPDNSCGH